MANLLKHILSQLKSYGEQVILHLHSPTFSAQMVHCKCTCFNDPSKYKSHTVRQQLSHGKYEHKIQLKIYIPCMVKQHCFGL